MLPHARTLWALCVDNAQTGLPFMLKLRTLLNRSHGLITECTSQGSSLYSVHMKLKKNIKPS